MLALKPPSIEKLGVQIVIDLIKHYKMRIHLTDLSSVDTLPLIQKYQNQITPKMSNLSFETSHHYLSLMSEEILNGKTEFKCSPPIRSNSNRNGLWDAMKSYEVFNVSSSHLPTSIKSKCLIGGKNRGNFIEASSGISSLQFGLPVFWTTCQQHSMTLLDVYRFHCLTSYRLYLHVTSLLCSQVYELSSGETLWLGAEQSEDPSWFRCRLLYLGSRRRVDGREGRRAV